MKKHLTQLFLAGTCGVLATTASAAISLNDTVVIDFTKNGQGTAGNWNNIQEADSGTDGWGSGGTETVTLSTDLIRFSDGAGTGVGLNYQGLDDGTDNDATPGVASNSGIGGLSVGSSDGAASFSVSGAIPLSAQQDVTFHVNGLTQYVFTGLNNSLTYDIEFQSWVSITGRDSTDWQINPDLGGSTITIDPNDSPSVYSFLGVPTDGSGNIVLRSLNEAGGVNNGHINALELTAVPEPSTYALLTGLLTLGLVMVRRRLKD